MTGVAPLQTWNVQGTPSTFSSDLENQSADGDARRSGKKTNVKTTNRV